MGRPVQKLSARSKAPCWLLSVLGGPSRVSNACEYGLPRQQQRPAGLPLFGAVQSAHRLQQNHSLPFCFCTSSGVLRGQSSATCRCQSTAVCQNSMPHMAWLCAGSVGAAAQPQEAWEAQQGPVSLDCSFTGGAWPLDARHCWPTWRGGSPRPLLLAAPGAVRANSQL